MRRLEAIDRLSMSVPGVEAAQGRRVGQLVAERLAHIDVSARAATLDGVRVELSARPGESANALAGRIASAVSLAIARAGTPGVRR